VEYIIGFAALLTAEYIALLAYFIAGALRLRRMSAPPTPEVWPSVSVIVPMRNEAEHAERTLAALAAQEYAGKLEFITVNDRSEDATGAILDRQATADSRFQAHHIAVDASPVPSPKKRALSQGFALARGDILMTTDADCLPHRHWVRSLACRFRGAIGIVQGPKRMVGDGRLLHVYQEQEVFGLVSIEAATFALGHPMMASAPSLAYRRSLYESVGGFQGIDDTVSGDDDLLVHKMSAAPGVQVDYAPVPEACVSTRPVDRFWPMVLQRARWSSNGTKYDDKGFVALLLGLYLFYVWLLVSPALVLFGLIPWWASLIPWLVKWVLTASFLKLTAKPLGQARVLRRFLPCDILHVPVVVVAVVLGQLGLYRWK
jgi:cellulose synthase/poly-beta-1,6-N-acetylglucosamine synthase-like glycosyltransferase